MKRKLREEGVKIFYVENCSMAKLKTVLKEFLSYVKRGDAAIIFFAGHGCEYQNSPRLLTITESKKHSLRNDSLNLYVLLSK